MRNERRRGEESDPGDHWSLPVGRPFGIPVRLHFTFLLLLIYFGVVGRGGPSLWMVVGVFACILLHEMGHALTARRFGYTVHRITLYPIGGVALMGQTPNPRHELWIALAGPAVNIVIVSLLTIYFQVAAPPPLLPRLQALMAQPDETMIRGSDLLALLAMANAVLAGFNLIPAFPMDGGRVLRALLALRMGEDRATALAARVGQAMAVAFGLVGILTNHFSLVLIALFVFFAASQERREASLREVSHDARIADAMITQFVRLPMSATLRDASEALLATSQQDFPVVHGDEVVGLLSRDRLLYGLAKEGGTAYVAGVMDRDLLFATPEEALETYLVRPDGIRRSPVLVRDPDGTLRGMVTQENVMEFLVLRRIAAQHAPTG